MTNDVQNELETIEINISPDTISEPNKWDINRLYKFLILPILLGGLIYFIFGTYSTYKGYYDSKVNGTEKALYTLVLITYILLALSITIENIWKFKHSKALIFVFATIFSIIYFSELIHSNSMVINAYNSVIDSLNDFPFPNNDALIKQLETSISIVRSVIVCSIILIPMSIITFVSLGVCNALKIENKKLNLSYLPLAIGLFIFFFIRFIYQAKLGSIVNAQNTINFFTLLFFILLSVSFALKKLSNIKFKESIFYICAIMFAIFYFYNRMAFYIEFAKLYNNDNLIKGQIIAMKPEFYGNVLFLIGSILTFGSYIAFDIIQNIKNKKLSLSSSSDT